MTAAAPAPDAGPLIRAIGPWRLYALTVNCVVGAGILGLPGRVAALAGDLTGWVVAAAALLSGAVALCLAELGGRFDGTGGPALYLRAAFGPGAGFVAGWLLWTATVLGAAALLTMLAAIVAPGAPAAAVIVAGAGLTLLTAAGAGRSSAAGAALTALKLLLLGGVAVAGLVARPPGAPAAALPPGTDPAGALVLLFFAFVGFERATAVAGEVGDPRRALPLALLGGVATVSLLYWGLFAACLRLVPDLAASERPVAEVAAQLLGPGGGRAVDAAAAAVVLGTLASQWITAPRLLYALAEAGQLPRGLARLSPARRTPDRAIVATGLAAVLLALGGNFVATVAASSASRLVIFAGCAAALLRLRRDGPSRFAVPGGPGLAIAVAAACLVLLAGAGNELGRLALLTGLGGSLWLVTRMRRR